MQELTALVKIPRLLWPLVLATAPYLYASAEYVPCKNHMTPEQQIELGNKARDQVYRTTPVLPDSSAATQYITALGKRLVAKAPGYKWPYNFHVANVAEVNAFALPGGTVFVNLGAIQAAETEAQLAGVMAHEISHVVLQHSVCNAEKQQRVGLFAGLGQIAAGVILGGAAGEVAQQGIGLTAGLGFLKMSREAEQQADLEGVDMAYDAGYDPQGLPQFFRIIQARYGSGSAQFLSDHPNPGNREEYVAKEISSLPARSDSTTTSPAFTQIKAQVTGMHAYTAREVASGVWKTRTANETVGSGIHPPPAPSQRPLPPDLNTAGSWKTFNGAGYSLEIPASWTTAGDLKSEMIGPSGGIVSSSDGGARSVAYGLLTDLFHPASGRRGSAAVDELLGEIARDNPGFRAGVQKRVVTDRATGVSVECDNPSANGGIGEHDWVAVFQHADRSLRYFVFVAPSPDFEKMRPVFQRVLQSVSMQN